VTSSPARDAQHLMSQTRRPAITGCLHWLTLVVAVSLTACTPGPAAADAGVDSGQPVSSPDCVAWARSWCQKLNDCTPRDLLVFWGELATCQQRAVSDCTYEAGAPGSGLTATAVQACTEALGPQSCSDFRVRRPGACQYRAAEAVTGACQFDSQCGVGQSCLLTNGPCGGCAPTTQSTEGTFCSFDSDCAAGLSCVALGNARSCQRRRGLGEACDTITQPCRAEFTCDQATCKPTGHVGQPCVGSNAACASYEPIACDSQTSTCTALPVSVNGQPCGSGLTPERLCGGGSRCSASATGQIGTCLGPVADGASCANASCLNPAVCDATLTCVLANGYCR
jgi:hypothetical protein